MFQIETASKIEPQIQVSFPMANAINTWFKVFYQEHADDKKAGFHRTNFANVLTGHMATLATNEITLNAGTSERGKYINRQIERFVLPSLRLNIQLAGVGGEIILKPYKSGSNLLCEAVTADRFYPTRINGTGMTEAGFFTDFDTLNGKKVVRIERFDLQPDGLYISNKAYHMGIDGLGTEISLTDVYRWKEIQPDLLISGVDRPLFCQLKMPFANTVDKTSLLPVSLYANAIDALAELDRIYSEFLWEIHTGKRRKIIDFTAIRPEKNGNRHTPNSDIAADEYIVLNLIGTDLKPKPFDDYTPEMRVEAYQKAVDIQLRLIEMQCGFSSGTFTFDIRTGKMTATQIISDDRDTYNTIKAIQDGGMAQGLRDLVYIYDVYATLYNLAPNGDIEPSVSFGDSIFEDTSVEFSRRKQLVDSGYLKPEKIIAWYFGISDEEAQKDYMPKMQTPDDILFGR